MSLQTGAKTDGPLRVDSLPIVTLREKKMMELMNAITDKEEWFIKVCSLWSLVRSPHKP